MVYLSHYPAAESKVGYTVDKYQFSGTQLWQRQRRARTRLDAMRASFLPEIYSYLSIYGFIYLPVKVCSVRGRGLYFHPGDIAPGVEQGTVLPVLPKKPLPSWQ